MSLSDKSGICFLRATKLTFVPRVLIESGVTVAATGAAKTTNPSVHISLACQRESIALGILRETNHAVV